MKWWKYRRLDKDTAQATREVLSVSAQNRVELRMLVDHLRQIVEAGEYVPLKHDEGQK